MNSVTDLHPPPADQVEHVWNKDTLAAVAAYGTTLEQIRKSRDTLNATKATAKAKLVEQGFDAGALKAAASYANTPEDKRPNWDESYIFARRAFGCPIQQDLFMAAMADQVTITTPTKE